MNELEIVERVVRGVTAAGKWEWELMDVRHKGILCQIIFNVNARYLRWSELSKVVKEMRVRVETGMAAAIHAGVPVTIASVSASDPEIVEEDGKLKVFSNVTADWVSGTENVGHDDVVEWMTEANLL